MSALVLIADHAATRRGELERCLRTMGHAAVPCSGAEEMARLAHREQPAACLASWDLPGLGNHLARLRTLPARPALLITAEAASLEQAIALGPFRVVASPVVPAALREVLGEELENRSLWLHRGQGLRRESTEETLFRGDSPSVRRLRNGIERVAKTETPVLLVGETGSGRGLCAREIHRRSTRQRVFLEVSCRGGDRRAAEGLFGVGREGRPGALDLAAGGSVHLAGVDQAGPGLQRQLQEVLEGQAWCPPGGSPRPAEVRWIASSERDLDREVERGRFAEELLDRLNVLTLRVPPLRERAEDLPLLAEAVLEGLARRGGPHVQLGPLALEALADHEWPGNLPELEAALVQATYAAGEEPIHTIPSNQIRDDGSKKEDAFMGERNLKRVEEALIRRVLEEQRGNRSRAAEVLGVNRTTLYNKLRVYEGGDPGRKLPSL